MEILASNLDNSQCFLSNNRTVGQNGAIAVKRLQNHFLEIFSKELVRGHAPNLELDPTTTSADDVVTATVLAFYARSIKNGAGEKMIFYRFFGDIFKTFPKVALSVIRFIPDPNVGGSWNDLNRLYEYISTISLHNIDNLRVFIVNMYANQIVDDLDIVANSGSITPSISLAAKYAPSEKTHFWHIIGQSIANRFYEIINPGSGKTAHSKVNALYRKTLTRLRAVIGVVETNMCSENWSKINFSRVPGIAMRNYGRWAFPNKVLMSNTNDRSRVVDRVECAANFEAYKVSVKKGESKINGSVVGLHQYGSSFESAVPDSNEAQLLELQFSDLIRSLQVPATGIDIDITKMIPIVDVSDSMDIKISGNVSAKSIAIQLGLILSQMNPNSAFSDRVLTFHSDPTWVNLSSHITYLDKYRTIESSKWGMSTDFEKVYNLILETAVESKLTSSQMSELKLIVFSDMQFNRSGDHPWLTAHQNLTLKFSTYGYPLPGCIFWNLAPSTTDGFVVDSSTVGVTMVSGFGTSQLKGMLSGNLHTTSPLEKMNDVLENSVFDNLRATVHSVLYEDFVSNIDVNL